MNKKAQLQEIAKVIQGGRHGLSGNDFVEKGYPAYGAGGLNGYLSTYEFETEAVILSSIGARCGKCFYANGKWSSLANTQVIIPNSKEVDAKFLWFQLNDENRWPRSGTGQPFIKPSDVKEHLVVIPPSSEQRRIADLLSRADRLRRLRRVDDTLSASMLQSVFLEMFIGNSTKFPKARIQDIASNRKYALSSGPFGSNLTSEHYVNRGVIVLRGLNISDGSLNLENIKYISEQKAKSLERSEVHPGDIVVVAVGSSGLACLIPDTLPRAIMSQNFNKVTPDTNKVNAVYLEHCLNSEYVQKQFGQKITDTVRTFLSLTKLKSVEIPLPPLPQQEQFAAVVRRVESLRARAGESERQGEGLFQSLLAEVFG